MATSRSFLSVSVGLVTLILSAQSADVATCPSYTEDFGVAVGGISESVDGSCDCTEMALIGLVARCSSVVNLVDEVGQVTCTPNDECSCYTRTAAEGEAAATEAFTAPQVAVQLGGGPFTEEQAYMWAFGGSPGQVILAVPGAPRRCILQLGGDAGEDEDVDSDDESDGETDDEDDDGSVCIEASRIPTNFAPYLVHTKPMPASVLCIAGSDMPCGTGHHTLVVDGERTSYGEFCKTNECSKKRVLVNAVFKHRWVEETYTVANGKRVVLPMGDFRFPDMLYSGVHYALDAARQMQTLARLNTVSRVEN